MIKRILISSIIASVLVACALGYFFYIGKFGNHFHYTRKSFKELPGWLTDDHQQAFRAFQQSCKAILKQKTNKNLQPWQKICTEAKNITQSNDQTAKTFFETWFEPYQITNNLNTKVLFTGYYLPLIKGSFTANPSYTVPIYGVPKDLLKIKISLFSKNYKDQKSLIGRVQDKTVYPYYDRKEIMAGIIKKTAKILLWSDSLVDVFFAQIQGSAIVQLPNQQKIVIGYAGDNGRPYTPIGKVLVSRNKLSKKSVSMQAIRNWLAAHPKEVEELLNQDKSYVFFTILSNNEVVGTQGVPLTPERSIAVDTRYVPLGAPIWVTTHVPDNKDLKPFNHLLIAQDTGGAIKDMHGDIYWGAGERAATIAGGLKNEGKWWLLLPRK